MEENIKYLYDDICTATKDITKIVEELKKINEPTLCVGCGGSHVVSEFISIVLNKKNHVITKNMEPRDVSYLDLNLYKNLVVASHGGKNYGVHVALENQMQKYLLSTRKTNISDETLLHYEMPLRKSFISLNATIVPMAIMLKYYLEDEFVRVLQKIFMQIDQNINLMVDGVYNIFTGVDTSVASKFIESTLVEAGMGIPIIHSKYDYCHGRSTINKQHNNVAIYLEYQEKDLDREVKDILKATMKESVVLTSPFEDEVVSEFYLTLASLYLLRNIANRKNIDLSDIDYDKIPVKRLYYFKGSM